MASVLFEQLQPSISDCEDASSLALPNGARFIRNLPHQGPLVFLHYLYPPLAREARARCELALGRELPKGVGGFLRETNGATLFDKAIYLFGFVERFTRSLAPEDQTAISLIEKNELFAACHQARWQSGWISVGSLVGWNTSLSLQAHSSGTCAVVCDDGREVEFESFARMVGHLVGRVSPCFTCSGVRDTSYRELEATLDGLLTNH